MTSKKRRKPGRGKLRCYHPEMLKQECESCSDRSKYRRQDKPRL